MILVHWTLWWESDPKCQNLGNISIVRFRSFESDLCSWRSLTFLEPEICWAGKYSILGELGLGITGSTWAPRSRGTSRWTTPSRERQCEQPCKNLDQILEQTRLPTFRSSSWCCSEERGGCRTSPARKSQIARSWTIIRMITQKSAQLKRPA